MKIFALCCLLTGLGATSLSQTPPRRTYEASFTHTPPVIDGRLDDSCWNQVAWGDDFIQISPTENTPPSQQTAFKILYDNNNLYVFIRAFDSEPSKISRRMTRRDYLDGDMVEIDIDSYNDKQTAFSFTAMASGAKGDAAITEDGNNWDDSWDPVWFLKTSIDNKGWSAEMKIPLSQLRFSTRGEYTWGIQVSRQLFRLEEHSEWQYIPKGSPGSVHLFGELAGIRNIRPKRQLILLPYVVGRVETFEKEPGNPFLNGHSSFLSCGLDGKAAITHDLTLDFSINPDFGQVEADPSEVNLTAFETYFSERRPLFVEGKNIYDFEPSNTIVISNMGADNLFYSRRIGRYPQYYPNVSDSVYVKMPESTIILGALKVSGKTRNGLSIGVLESLTKNEKARIDSAGIQRKESVEPLTNYFVGRVQKDFKKGETVIGGMITSVNRDITNPALDFLHKAAYVGGLDFKHYWKERTWYLAANAEFSQVRGKPEAIITTEESSARYYQRPDAGYVSVDSSRNSLSGYGGTLKLGRYSKKRIQFETSATVRSPGLEFNDIGYMRYADVIHHGTWVAYYERNPFFIFRNFYLNTNYWMYWNFSGKLLTVFTNFNFNAEFKNRWRINGNCTRKAEGISTNLLRGGPSFVMPGSEDMNLNIMTDQSKKFSFNAGSYQGFGDAGSYRNRSYWMGVYWRPMNAVSVSFEPEFDMNHSALQYVDMVQPDGNPEYIFASLNQKTVEFTFRLNYTINPELTIEYYGQPFISAGHYNHYKRITNPSAGIFRNRYHQYTDQEISYMPADNSYAIDETGAGKSDFSIGNPDFNFRQFRSNLVIRWEYKPGSTLYLVWSQSRTGSVSRGNMEYGNDMKDLFSIVPHNILLLKFSYWFSL